RYGRALEGRRRGLHEHAGRDGRRRAPVLVAQHVALQLGDAATVRALAGLGLGGAPPRAFGLPLHLVDGARALLQLGHVGLALLGGGAQRLHLVGVAQRRAAQLVEGALALVQQLTQLAATRVLGRRCVAQALQLAVQRAVRALERVVRAGQRLVL